MRNFFNEMLKAKREIYKRRDRLVADIFTKIQAFVEEGSYSTCKKAGKVAELSLKGYDARDLAEYFGLKYDTIRTEKRLISNELWGIFPQDFFEKLLSYRDNRSYIDNCISSINNFDISSNNILLLDVLKIVNNYAGDVGSYDIPELRDELDFLARYSKAFLDEDIRTLDMDKLRYIVNVLDRKNGDLAFRSEIIKEMGVNNVKM